MQVTIDSSFVIATVLVVSAILSAGIWVGKITYKQSDAHNLFKEIKGVLVDIKEALVAEDKRFSKGRSPRQLTEFGKEVAATMKAEEWARRLISNRKFAHVREPYEADYYARQHADADRSDETKRMIWKGMYQSALDEASIRRILAIVLREEIIKQLRKP